jgi:hypothetical protein
MINETAKSYLEIVAHDLYAMNVMLPLPILQLPLRNICAVGDAHYVKLGKYTKTDV